MLSVSFSRSSESFVNMAAGAADDVLFSQNILFYEDEISHYYSICIGLLR